MRVAFIPFSIENMSGLEPPILYVFPSLPKSPNTNHTCRGKRPGKKYAEKKNHWKNERKALSHPTVAAWVELALSRASYIPTLSPPGAAIQCGLPSLQLEAAGPHPGDLVGPAEWPRSVPRAGQLDAGPGGAQASIQPPSPSYPDVKDIITRLMTHSPVGPSRKECGRGLLFCTGMTQCILEGRR